MGGDFAPQPIIEGAIQAARQLGHEIILVGEPGVLRREIERLGAAHLPVRIEASDSVVLIKSAVAPNPEAVETLEHQYRRFRAIYPALRRTVQTGNSLGMPVPGFGQRQAYHSNPCTTHRGERKGQQEVGVHRPGIIGRHQPQRPDQRSRRKRKSHPLPARDPEMR